ncbi:hypothetical protein H6F89_31920 [Cyanobacteria bacterium FACHB-63]|nr:hypothetical protein [Cyanobacteria bacterium FACHB-63]
MSILLRRLSEDETWVAIEQALSRQILRVYDLRPQTVRLDATTVSGYHVSEPERLFQFGHSKDDPTLPQVKVMMGVLDRLGLPLVTHVVSGETADDGLYVPAIEQVQHTLDQTELLFVGDCKLAAIETRGFIQTQGHFYLCPLAATGKVPEQLSAWVTQALQDPMQQIEVKINSGDERTEAVIAHGIEVNRSVSMAHSDLT